MKLAALGLSPDFARSVQQANTQSVIAAKNNQSQNSPNKSNAPQNRSVQIPKNKPLKPIQRKVGKASQPKQENKRIFKHLKIFRIAAPLSKEQAEKAVKEVEELRAKLHKELLEVLEAEQKKEAEREEALKKAPNEEESKKLEKSFGIERAKASDRIIKMSE